MFKSCAKYGKLGPLMTVRCSCGGVLELLMRNARLFCRLGMRQFAYEKVQGSGGKDICLSLKVVKQECRDRLWPFVDEDVAVGDGGELVGSWSS